MVRTLRLLAAASVLTLLAAASVLTLVACAEPTPSEPLFAKTPKPTVWCPSKDHCYEVTTAPVYGSVASSEVGRAKYRGLRGHLVTITSAQENADVLALIGTSSSRYWTGALVLGSCYTVITDCTWGWSNGEPFSYTNWDTDNAQPFTDVAANRILISASNGKWYNTNGVWEQHPYIIEYER